jgi:hypothetical protein
MPSLTRSRVCNFQLSIFYRFYFGDSPNLEGHVPVYISPRNRVAQLHPRALGSNYKFNGARMKKLTIINCN